MPFHQKAAHDRFNTTSRKCHLFQNRVFSPKHAKASRNESLVIECLQLLILSGGQRRDRSLFSFVESVTYKFWIVRKVEEVPECPVVLSNCLQIERSEKLLIGWNLRWLRIVRPRPQTKIAPSPFFGDIGVKRTTEEQQKLSSTILNTQLTGSVHPHLLSQPEQIHG